MKKRILAILLILILASSTFYCDGVELNDYEEYTIDEFPDWSWKLRRGESLFFGSLAITFPLTVLSYNLLESASIISSTDDDITEFTYQISVAAVISLSIALADYIIGEME
jgi:hypothetical protein